MKKRLWLPVLTAIVLSLSLVSVVLAGAPDYKVEAGKVYIDTEVYYLSATPATLKGSGWVEFEVTPKIYTGDLDLVWGFTGTDRQPTKVDIWDNDVAHDAIRYVEREVENTIKLDGVKSLEPNSRISSDSNDTRLSVSYYDALSKKDITRDINCSSYRLTGDTVTITYYDLMTVAEPYTEYYDDYKLLSNIKSPLRYDYYGVSEWYTQALGSVIAGETYRTRAYIEVPITGVGDSISKYVFGVKPSNVSIPQAYYDDSLVVIDPWLSGGWGQRIEITIDGTDVGTELTDYPVMLYLSAASGIGDVDVSSVFDELTADANRKKIAVTQSDGTTQCYVEIEYWDDASETAYLWTKIPTIDDGVDTTIYLYYDADHADNDSYVGDTGDAVAQGVWNSSYEAVYHMVDNGANSLDSTDNGNTLAEDGATGFTGKIDGAYDLDGTNDFLAVSTPNTLGLTGDFTINCWLEFNTHAGSDYPGAVVKSGAGGASGSYYSINVVEATRKLELVVRTSTQEYFGASSQTSWTVDEDAWNMVSFMYDQGTMITAYKDGDSGTSSPERSVTGTLSSASTPLWIGKHGSGTAARFWDEGIDEVQIINGVMSDNWIASTYQNQIDDFVTFGEVETANAPDVTTSAATGVGYFSATMNGEVTAINDSSITERGFDYDTDSGEPYTYSWSETEGYSTGTFSHEFTDLDTNQTYYFRAYAINDTEVTGYGDELNFTTPLSPPLAPTNFTVTQAGADNVTITWDKGSYATTTVIRGKTESYPTSISDGWEVYNDTGTNTTDDNLNLTGTGYYYRAWSYNATGYSETYAQDDTGGVGMLFLGILFGAIALTAIGYSKQNLPLSYSAGGLWAIMMALAHQQATSIEFGGAWDTYGMLFWVFMGLLLLCMLEPVIYRKPKALAEEVAELSDSEAYQQEWDDHRKELNASRLHFNSRRKKKKSKFDYTGVRSANE